MLDGYPWTTPENGCWILGADGLKWIMPRGRTQGSLTYRGSRRGAGYRRAGGEGTDVRRTRWERTAVAQGVERPALPITGQDRPCGKDVIFARGGHARAVALACRGLIWPDRRAADFSRPCTGGEGQRTRVAFAGNGAGGSSYSNGGWWMNLFPPITLTGSIVRSCWWMRLAPINQALGAVRGF